MYDPRKGFKVGDYIVGLSRKGWGQLTDYFDEIVNRPDLKGWFYADMRFDDSPGIVTPVIYSQPGYQFTRLEPPEQLLC